MAAFAPLVQVLGVGWTLGGLAVVGVLVSYVYLRTRANVLPKGLRKEWVLWRLATETGLVGGAVAGAIWVLMFSPQGSRVLFSVPEWDYEAWLLPLRIAALPLGLLLCMYADWRLRRVLGRKGRALWQEGAEVIGLIVAISGVLLGFGTLAVEALG